MKAPLTLDVNGMRHELEVSGETTLLDALREELGLTGTKKNCLEAECGVCTVLLDGKAVNSCILLAHQCEGRNITTVEGLARPGSLSPLQQAFIQHGAVQCGFCIPGMLVTAQSYLDELDGRAPDRDEVREAIAGTLCRCTGYSKIVDAIEAEALRLNAARWEAC
ncbi:(2Fe-2S)-binding protein [Mesorhizobium sp. LHD-90]|uniref:(2Fe-2S)-binding protein n=1 Tax=Mesorhizobium sp. LHD-90 TaxID=3071414 RepID=UPI0027E0D9A0|nr:2Fe-2S iron-sulfur cluster-binding protein [Mesorhizobium sp. LHD-90]MDQ6433222.1 (2Fe-2S)-binding protein [Mesorhizobium sp. LHD-90]